jgi:hypothetical protein
MPGFLAVIAFIFFCIYAAIKKPSKRQPSHPSKRPSSPLLPIPQKAPAKPMSTSQGFSKTSVTIAISTNKDVIDVTGQDENILAMPPRVVKGAQSDKPVIPWPTRSILSLNDFQLANKEQRSFYFYFRNSFLQEINIDLAGNPNYAFILLFDLAGEYASHKDSDLFEQQLARLARAYPETAPSAKSVLRKYRLQRSPEIPQTAVPAPSLSSTPIDHSEIPLYGSYTYGTKYKTQLSLTPAEVNTLDGIYYGNVVFDHSGCQLAIVGLFVQLLRRLKEYFETSGTTFDATIQIISDKVARKEFRFRVDSANYKLSLAQARSELHHMILKYCDNAVREAWEVKRRLSINGPWNHAEVNTTLNEVLKTPIDQILSELTRALPTPDEPTEIFLNSQNTTRWKSKLDDLKEQFTPRSGADFYQKVLHMGKLNQNNPSIENIFFEASKFIGKRDIHVCLCIYVHYIYHDQRSKTVDDKALGKALLKNLFYTPESEKAFDIIVRNLKSDRDLPNALKAVSGLFERKRRKIDLNSHRIELAESAYIHTVDVLNVYLDDSDTVEAAETVSSIPTSSTSGRVPIPLTDKPITETVQAFAVSLTPVQQQFILVFSKHNRVLSVGEIDAFARQNAVFRSHLIDGINEACYELLEDLLIEPEGENYILQDNYLKRIIPHDH